MAALAEKALAHNDMESTGSVDGIKSIINGWFRKT